MASYKRKHLNSIKQLDREQRRIKKMYREIEKNWTTGILTPQVTGLNTLSAITSLLSKKNKRTSNGQGKQALEHSNASNLLTTFANNETVQKLALNTGRSWLRWQAFNLSVFLLKKGWQSLQEYRKKRKSAKCSPANKMLPDSAKK